MSTMADKLKKSKDLINFIKTKEMVSDDLKREIINLIKHEVDTKDQF